MKSQEFITKAHYNTTFEGEDEVNNFFLRFDDSPSPTLPPMLGISHQEFQPNFVNKDFHNSTYYHSYSNHYSSPYPYHYGSSSYKGNNFTEGRRYQGYKKYNNQSPPNKYAFYAKKAHQATKPAETDLVEDFNKMTIKETETVARNNAFEKLPSPLEKAQFFVIKSYSEEDVHKAVKYNVWCSTIAGNLKLHDAYITADNKYPIYLLFSVNASGHFVGVAQMKSSVDFNKNFGAWNQHHKWKGVFDISWIYIKDVPNKELRHLKNEYNEGKSVPHSRDCQEVPFELGKQVLEIFEAYKNQTSIMDDYDFYEKKQLIR